MTDELTGAFTKKIFYSKKGNFKNGLLTVSKLRKSTVEALPAFANSKVSFKTFNLQDKNV